MLNHDEAVTAVASPSTPASQLVEIAAFPDLHTQIAFHPNVYLGMLDWLEAHGDPTVIAAVTARRTWMEAPSDAMLPKVESLPQAGHPPSRVNTDTMLADPVRAASRSAEVIAPLASAAPSPKLKPDTAPIIAPLSAATPGVTLPPQPVILPQAGPLPQPVLQPYNGYPQPYAGYPGQYAQYPGYPGYPQPYSATATFQAAKDSVWKAFQTMTGGEGQVIVRFRDLFRDTFKKHTREDLNALIYTGTAAADYRPRLPWFYARVFGLLFGSFFVLWLCYIMFRDSATNLVPGVILLGAMAVPMATMFFFWEFDQTRSVSIFVILQIFFLGGAFSLLLTFIIDEVTYAFIPNSHGVGAALAEGLVVGISEEAAKVIVVFFLVRRMYGCLVSNGLLVGAIVGTSFAVFETMGYGLVAWANDRMEWTLFIRGVLSIGGHIVWTAIAGAAIMLAQRPGTQYPDVKTLQWGKFFALFSVPVVLHSAWDFFMIIIDSNALAYTVAFALVVVAWIFIVRLINTGLRQYAGLVQPAST